MTIKLPKLLSIKMLILGSKDNTKKCNLKNDIMNESDLQKICIYPIYPSNSKIYSDKGFVTIDNGIMGGTHWKCFVLRSSKSFYFDCLGGHPDNQLLNQSPIPIMYHNYKIQDKNFGLCGSFCSYFIYLFQRMNFNDTILKCILIK